MTEEIRSLDRRVELLVPAGRSDVLESVLDAGADAVYLSGKRFQMRAHRSDFHFTDAELRQAVDCIHARRRRAYVTVNTLVGTEEIDGLQSFLAFLGEIGIDGAIVCDLAAISLARKLDVPYELHASTMMNVHDPDQARFLKDLGLSRIVTSRDISIREAGLLGEYSGLPIEYFLHGDMCVAQSGQCAMSGLLFGKSANRGECMKPCRWTYELVSLRDGHSSGPLKEGHLMAIRDLALLRQVPDLVEAGICALKIEGRMRDAAYLGQLTRLYRETLDSYYAMPSAFCVDAGALHTLFKQRVRDFSTLGCTGAASNASFFDISGRREPLRLSEGLREPELAPGNIPSAGAANAQSAPRTAPSLAVCVASAAAAREALASGASRLYLAAETSQFGGGGWSPETLHETISLAAAHGVPAGLRTPRVSTSHARAEWRRLQELCAGQNVRFVLVHHLGALKRALQGLPGAAIIADYGFNVLNPLAANELRELGAAAVTPALEAGFDDIRALALGGGPPLELLVHGPIAGMLLNHCLIAANLTKGASKEICRGPCKHNEFALRDAKGEERLIVTDQYCRNHLLTAKDLGTLPALDQLLRFGAASCRIEAQFYTAEHTGRITRAYRDALDRWAAGQAAAPAPEAWTELQSSAPRPWNFGGYAQRITHSESTAALMKRMR